MSKLTLFTPGPLNTTDSVRSAMCRDVGSRTPECKELTADIQSMLKRVAECGNEFAPILLQGSGTFAIEAMITTLISSEGHIAIIDNGPYGRRIASICEVYGISCEIIKLPESKGVAGSDLVPIFQANKKITHLAIVHFETALGIKNCLDTVLSVCESYGIALLLDSMSAFGALPINFKCKALAAVACSSNKCLHGVPGVGIVFVRLKEFDRCDTVRSLSLDLRSQYESFQIDGEWRFTPPIQVLLALRQAIIEYFRAGGREGRIKKYSEISDIFLSELPEMGMFPVIDYQHRAPIIITFSLPPTIQFNELYEYLLGRNLVIYPSKSFGCFRLGCIGELTKENAYELMSAIKIFLLQSGDDA